MKDGCHSFHYFFCICGFDRFEPENLVSPIPYPFDFIFAANSENKGSNQGCGVHAQNWDQK